MQPITQQSPHSRPRPRAHKVAVALCAALALATPLAVAAPAHATAPAGPICGTASYSTLTPTDRRTYWYIGTGPVSDGNTVLRYWLVETPGDAAGGRPNTYRESYVAHCGPTGLITYDEPALLGYKSTDPQCAATSTVVLGAVDWFYVGQRVGYIQVLPTLVVPHPIRYWELLDTSMGPGLALSSVVAEC